MTRERNTWYWLSDPREGDIFTPVFVNSEGQYYMDGEQLGLVPSTQIESLRWDKAEMPREH